jgi:hypothetical protein
MPTHKFTITIIGENFMGTKIIKYNEKEKDYIVYYLKHKFNVDCKVEKTRIY